MQWFDDALGHFKRSPQPHVRDGVMISQSKRWWEKPIPGMRGVDYSVAPPVLSDVFTGRLLSRKERQDLRKPVVKPGLLPRQPSQYRPDYQDSVWKPKPPVAGERINPVTKQKEPRRIHKTYGCDGGVDYGYLYTLRSGTAAFYDKRTESGTIHIAGPRSGCTGSMIPAGGLLNVPYFYEGCTCSYPLPAGLALRSMPESHEQWAVWGAQVISNGIQRIGLNFGAPGDRVTRDGTFWKAVPETSAPTIKLPLTMNDGITAAYRHSIWMQGGTEWPWVAASCADGLQELELKGLKPGPWLARLIFCRNEEGAGLPVHQRIDIQGEAMAEVDTLKQPVGAFHSWKLDHLFRSEGEFRLSITPMSSELVTRLSGLELIWIPEN